MSGQDLSVTAVVVDDEELARCVVLEYLERHPWVRVVAECANGFEAVKAVAEHRPQLLFLDIQMPKLNGFEVLELVDDPGLAVVFVTAYDTYAMKAFEVHAVDYLLKPFTVERFDAALKRALERVGQPKPAAKELAAAARPAARFERIVVKDGVRVEVIPVARLDYAEAQDDYVCLHAAGKRHLKQQTISALEEALDPGLFVRIHRGYLVNLERVERIEPYAKDSRVAILRDGTRLPVSRAGYARLKELLEKRG